MKECPKCESIVTEDSTKYYNGLIKFGCDSTIHWDSSGKECFSQTEVCILRAELTKLKSDVERLRGALKPFATVVEVINKNVMCDGGPIPDESFLLAHWEWNTSSDLTIGDCRNAARALEETR